MDTELVQAVRAAATTFVNLLATDAWQLVKVSLGGWWRAVDPGNAARIEGELEATRTSLLASPDGRQPGEAEEVLATAWCERLLAVLGANPDARRSLRQILDELTPILAGGRSVGEMNIRAVASGDGRNYVVGQGDLHVHG